MNATIENMPRQTINRKIKLFVVKMNGNEIGVIEKLLSGGFEARFLYSPIPLGLYTTKQNAALALVKAQRSLEI